MNNEETLEAMREVASRIDYATKHKDHAVSDPYIIFIYVAAATRMMARYMCAATPKDTTTPFLNLVEEKETFLQAVSNEWDEAIRITTQYLKMDS